MKNDFGFVIHPIAARHVTRAVPVLRLLPKPLLRTVMKTIRPHRRGTVGPIRSANGAETSGMFLIVPLLPRQMVSLPEDEVVERIVQAGRIAERNGAGILGLGAYTAVVGGKGRTVAERLDIPVTTGTSLTAWSVLETLAALLPQRGLDPARSTLGIIGATGAVGMVCARRLSRSFSRTLINGRRTTRLVNLKQTLGDTRVEIEPDPHVVARRSDVLVVTTSAPRVLLQPSELKSGAVVCDISVPPNIRAGTAMPDRTLIYHGGMVRLPAEPRLSLDIDSPSGVVYGCLAETMLLALDRRRESFSLGEDIDPARVDEIGDVARRHGFCAWLPDAD